jgi:hypothetical protein
MFSLRVAGIASVMAVVASISVMAQTTGTIPPPAPTSQPPLSPPTANQYSSNEIIDAGHHFFGSVSHGLAMVVEKAVSQWGLPNGYILGEEASGAFIGGLRYGDGTLDTRNAGDVRENLRSATGVRASSLRRSRPLCRSRPRWGRRATVRCPGNARIRVA